MSLFLKPNKILFMLVAVFYMNSAQAVMPYKWVDDLFSGCKVVDARMAYLAKKMAERMYLAIKSLELKGYPTDVLVVARRGTSLHGKLGVLPNKKADGSFMSLVDIDKMSKKYRDNVWMDQRSDEEEEWDFDPYNYFESELLTDKQIDYSHAGFIVKNNPGSIKMNRKKNGKPLEYSMVHMLKPCEMINGEVHSVYKTRMKEETLPWFFIDDPDEYAAYIAVPSKTIQKRLRKMLIKPVGKRNPYSPGKWYNGKRYNILAKPFQMRELNSNQPVIEYLTAASTMTERQIKAMVAMPEREGRSYLFDKMQQTGYHHTNVLLGSLLAGANMVVSEKLFPHFVNFESQQEFKYNSTYEIATTQSLREWAKKNKLFDAYIEVALLENELVVPPHILKNLEDIINSEDEN